MKKSTKQYTKQIEKDFKEKEKWHIDSRPYAKTTSEIDVLRVMILYPNKIWWWSWELIGVFQNIRLSHRAPARASDLANYSPDFVETRKCR